MNRLKTLQEDEHHHQKSASKYLVGKGMKRLFCFIHFLPPLESSLGRIPRNAQVPLVTRRLPSNQVGVGEMM